MNKTYYYSLILLKKIRIKIHNLFEKKVLSNNDISLEDLNILLWRKLLQRITFRKNNFYFNSKVKNKKAPMLLSHARTILIITNTSKNFSTTFDSKYLARNLTDFLISLKDKRGLYKFNQDSWNLQDEGIASVWATLALVKSFEYLNESKYLDEAIITMNSMLENLYSKETSLLHTEGEDYWCLNSASTLAYACSLILKHTHSEKIINAMNDSINLCVDKIAEDGHYPYNSVRLGTYLLLYHPIVIITLEYCLKSEYLKDEVKNSLIEANSKARLFLKKCIKPDGRIFEPEVKHFSQYIISNVTTLIALKGFIDRDLEEKITNNICSFWNKELYLCRNDKNYLYNSDLYSVADVLGVEVLFWLDTKI